MQQLHLTEILTRCQWPSVPIRMTTHAANLATDSPISNTPAVYFHLTASNEASTNEESRGYNGVLCIAIFMSYCKSLISSLPSTDQDKEIRQWLPSNCPRHWQLTDGHSYVAVFSAVYKNEIYVTSRPHFLRRHICSILAHLLFL